MSDLVLIIGAGTMGAGIAQVAATHGWTAALRDVNDDTVRGAVEGVRKRLARLVEKGKLSEDDAAAASGRLRPARDDDVAAAALVIEAVVEDLDVKTAVLTALLPRLDARAIIATNTSSLSVTAIGRAIGEPTRTVGMHFFNPAPLLRLVEVIAGADTDPVCARRVAAIAEAWGKIVARAADVPGFIVNHVARPYYLEAFRILEEGHADAETIDRIMKRVGGFRMGPFELTDLIGQDVNTATTRSVWEQLDRPPLLEPSRAQEKLVSLGQLGRKTGRGVYDYSADPPRSLLTPGVTPPPLPPRVAAASERFAESGALALPSPDDDPVLSAFVFARIVVALIAQAAHAHERGVASEADIDNALRYGTNYPKGPFAWAADIGRDTVCELLTTLDEMVQGGRFAVPALLEVRRVGGR